MMESTLKDHVVAIGRTMVAAMLTTVMILAGLGLVYGEQNRQRDQLAETTLYANLAQACVLSLPVDPEVGRPEEDVKLCFTQYGLQAPELTHP